ncbi:hypothetical protein BO70DRAFT_289842 [Aspergillus heteromorphus CBS 117.55]|uniref:Uncharacterized protein n=1 Tax=Aspergillus heteromorphus CBS 117.55 TaxID=1448321 RepID=A0A317WGY3_9EURO|nr:uncharacterized protein BO70DRAFT_289842 [Aspergillus heteromorphus CBS 117.55]PWY84941.1 hypothetical protein BO70DRAFT_289842 [Aspergillus heteromorphus CBS 117.55]
MRAAERSLNAQLSQEGARLPEPTYLRPVNNAYSHFHPVPLSQHDIWYGPNEGHIRGLSNGQNAPVTTASTPITGFDGSESLVEESQDWWSRESSALHFGMDDWVQGWNSGIPGRAPDMRYASTPNYSTVGHTPGPENTSRAPLPPPPPPPSQNMRYAVGVAVPHPPPLPGTSKPEHPSGTPGYNTMGFPGDFQR